MSKEKAADYFSRHQSSNECHITSDGRVFHTKGSADGFANQLKDNTVNSYTRAEFEAKNIEVNDPVEETGTTGTGAGTEATEKVYTVEDLKAFDATVATYPDAKNLVKGLKLETKSQKMPDLLEAIATAKTNLETQD